MSEQQVFTEISLDELLGHAAQMKAQGRRFVQCHATRGAGITQAEGQEPIPTFELTYSFSDDANRALSHVRVIVTQGQSIPSVSSLFPAAFMFENEMHDLFGIAVKGISIDYQGGFYHLHYPAPMAQAPEKPAHKGASKKPETDRPAAAAPAAATPAPQAPATPADDVARNAN